jgi:hypothetical protein
MKGGGTDACSPEAAAPCFAFLDAACAAILRACAPVSFAGAAVSAGADDEDSTLAACEDELS